MDVILILNICYNSWSMQYFALDKAMVKMDYVGVKKNYISSVIYIN